MRLLFVHERFGALGGAESNVLVTATELAHRGHAIGLLHGPGTGKGEENWAAIFSHRYGLDSRLGGRVAREALRTFDPDVVHVHKMADLDVIEALVQSGRPLVRMVHDHDIYCMKSYKYAYFSRRICRRPLTPYCLLPCGAFLARNRDGLLPVKYVSYRAKRREVELNRQFHRVVVVSEYMRRELLGNGFDAARIEIHPPVPRRSANPLRSTFSERNLIVFAGQIIRGKGVDLLLEALARLEVPFECALFGEGSHRPHCERLAGKLGLKDRVRFKGFVPQEELRNCYRECSVVALSSVWPEPIATVGLEVMGFALPVVAFDAGGIEDWLIDGHNGFLVPWGDRAVFAARLQQLLTDKMLAREMGERGLRLLETKFDFHRYIQDLEDMFAAVAAERSARPDVRSG